MFTSARLNEIVDKVLTKKEAFLSEKMHKQLEEEKEEKQNRHQLFLKNLEIIKRGARKQLEFYLDVRRSNYSLSLRKLLFGSAISKMEPSNRQMKHEDYFSKKNSDLFSLDMYEQALALIQKIQDVVSTKQIISELSILGDLTADKSSHLSGWIKSTRQFLQNTLNKYFPEEDKIVDQYKKSLGLELEGIRNEIKTTVNGACHDKYADFLRANPKIAEYIKCYNLFCDANSKLQESNAALSNYQHLSLETAFLHAGEDYWSWGDTKSESELWEIASENVAKNRQKWVDLDAAQKQYQQKVSDCKPVLEEYASTMRTAEISKAERLALAKSLEVRVSIILRDDEHKLFSINGDGT